MIKNIKKTKMEFSKKWLIGYIIISIVYTTFSYVLAWFDKNAVEMLAVKIIGTQLKVSSISFAGYIIKNCVRLFTVSEFESANLVRLTDKKKAIATNKNWTLA